MGETLLCRLGFFLLWSLCCGYPEADKPRAKLTADRTIIPAGGSITLSCSVDESDDWKFDWFRNDQQYSVARFRGTSEPNRVISVSEGGEYSCRGGRGDPVFHTEKSNVQKIVSGPTVNRHPSWPVVFRGETVTLRCEMQDDEGTQWTYEWSPSNRKSPTSNEYRISRVSKSDSGSYWCKASKGYQRSGWSSEFKLTVKSNGPKASIKASPNIIPAGGSVTLSCFIYIGVGWKFDWFRLESKSSTAQPIRTNESDGVLSISEGGEYSCRGGRGDPVFYTETSREVTIEKTVPITPTVIQQPNWAQIYRGERVTLRCEIQDDGGTQWTYEWKPNNINSPTSSEFMITADSRGDYKCRGRRDSFTFTKWGVITLTMFSDEPRAKLTADRTIIPAGGSITLSCSVDESDDWKFDWFRNDQQYSADQFRSINELYRVIYVTEEGEYSCRGGRGDTVFKTAFSGKVSVLRTVSKPTVILQPNRPVVYRGEKVTLRCEIQEGGRTEWTYEWKRNNGNAEISSNAYRTITVYKYHSGEYSCMARGDHELTEWSDAVTLTVRPDEPRAKLTADRTIIPAGGSITLSCSLDESDDWKFDWFRNDQQYSVARFRGTSDPNRVISVSDEGVYSCRGGRGDPVFQTENSNQVFVQKTVSKPTVMIQPSGPVVYRGEKVTLRCEIQEGGTGTEWMYEWKTNNGNAQRRSGEYRTITVYKYHSGEYSCMARGDHQLTEWSDAVTLTVRPDKPRTKLTADRTIIPAGGSITLSCSVDESDDWKFDWFRNEQQYSVARYRSNDELYRVIYVSDEGVYSCRGGRGDPVFHTEKSNVQKIVSGPTVNQHPSWPVVFRGETVTLRCEMQDDEGTQWTYEWSPRNRNSPTSNEYRISRVSESDSGSYWCKASKGYQRSDWSSAFKLTVNSNEPKASIKASDNIIPAGGSVTLTCFMDIGVGWKFDWFRLESKSSTAQPIRTNESDGVLSISEGGEYSCRGGRGDPVFYTETSREVTIEKTVPITPTVIQQPNWANIYIGERVTLRCEIQEDGGTQWTYEWRPNNINSPTSSEFMITADNSGYYGCRGRRDSFTLTKWGVITLTVFSPKPQPVLSVSPSWPNPGASVTLSCESLELQSAGWRFFWHKAVPDISSSTYRFDLLPGSTNGTEQNSFIINGPTHTAGFVCRAGRGEPKFYTDYSEPMFVWSADSHPAASLSVSPDRVQHLMYQSVTMKCGGNDTKWRMRRFTESTSPTYVQCSNWGKMDGSSCTINTLEDHSGVYWCESGSGEFSNAVNITVQDDYYDGVILVSPVHPVTEGDPVTLSCRDKKQNLLSNVFFYHNNKLINNDGREELKISAVSKSDEGFYKCQHSGKESPSSWMSVRVTESSPVGSSSPLLLIIGPISGIVLIIFLHLLWRCRQPRDLCSFRSEKNNQRSTTNHRAEIEISDNNAPSQGVPLYESVKPSEATAAAEPREITYAMIQVKKLRKKKKPRKPEERVIYAEVKTRAAELAPTYAEINKKKVKQHRKELAPTYAEINKKKVKQHRKEKPAATDESVYSEIKSGATLEDESAL
ncbi:Fc receptor-like protein 5 [Xiphophorus hellerii]|uniref:Fc receptor-like protein 5 n=1 Tax=Xiphophorus hellerii TaxID=8084 RepID=UPI0013B3B476|nr:Fc receptor-like protein 5 [Xiphophorus hellerii]